ncbi:uncharacterized protein KGF55_005566 [Candida pseudojiufengensis]|uniref:uncharacterized protein n=1 Tax=Candida pseudojiufengensis TaxID=497109 RepID=UPI002224E914|nr:uncharacterized protein KGF55_005566 [Candida pseudojiufengensis]KAI5959075.1 hypothetical protein KGF55_005566 [Candida pseudojiufengensis]
MSNIHSLQNKSFSSLNRKSSSSVKYGIQPKDHLTESYESSFKPLTRGIIVNIEDSVKKSTTTRERLQSLDSKRILIEEEEPNKVEDCEGNLIHSKEAGLFDIKVFQKLKSFQLPNDQIRKNGKKAYSLTISKNGIYLAIGEQKSKFGNFEFKPLDGSIVNLETQLREFSFAEDKFILQLKNGEFIIASHYGRDDEIRSYFKKYPNPKIKEDKLLTKEGETKLINYKFNDPLKTAGTRAATRSSLRIATAAALKENPLEEPDKSIIDIDEVFFSGNDYVEHTPIPNFKPPLRYIFQNGYKITVTQEDFKSLHRNNWINDVAMDFGLRYIVDDAVNQNIIKSDETYVFNSFFYSKLVAKNENPINYYQNIKKWVNKIDLLKYRYVILPVNEDYHWYCCIIRNLPDLLSSDEDIEEIDPITKKIRGVVEIFVFDSLKGKRDNVKTPLKKFIIDYCKDKYDIEVTSTCISVVNARVPRQNNFNDCGIHVLYNIKKWIKNMTQCESNWRKFQVAVMKSIFSGEERSKERTYWINILIKLHSEQDLQPEELLEDDEDVVEIVMEPRLIDDISAGSEENQIDANGSDSQEKEQNIEVVNSQDKEQKIEVINSQDKEQTITQEKEEQSQDSYQSVHSQSQNKINNEALQNYLKSYDLSDEICNLLNKYFDKDSDITRVKSNLIKHQIDKLKSDDSITKFELFLSTYHNETVVNGVKNISINETKEDIRPKLKCVEKLNEKLSSKPKGQFAKYFHSKKEPDFEIESDDLEKITPVKRIDAPYSGIAKSALGLTTNIDNDTFKSQKKDARKLIEEMEPQKRSRYRPQLNEKSGSDSSNRSLPEIPQTKIIFEPTDNLSFISIVKQLERYEINETNEYIRIEKHNRFNKLSIDNEFWNKYILDYSNEIIRRREIDLLENEIIKGIPESIRSIICLKTLNINYSFINDHALDDLKIKSSRYNGEVSTLVKTRNGKEILSIFYSMFQDNELKDCGSFLGNITDLIIDIPGLSTEEQIYILFKIYNIYRFEKKDDLIYKINRSLEDNLSSFNHIASQGINWSTYYKSVLPKFFALDTETSLIILDLFLFEGFNFLLRLIVWIFINNQNLSELNGKELSNYINSIEFLTENEYNFKEILNLNPPIINYENELYLIKSNSMNNNSNELKNLIDINEDLQIKINESNVKINNLQATHIEISQQSQEYNKNLSQAEEKRQTLVRERDELKQKYNHLTMKENLLNTIKANKEFSERNNELQQQLNTLKNSIAEKKHKLSKAPS